jgi:hypothetical protein
MSDEGSGGGIMGIVGFILILGLVNLLSWVFHWGFWIY